VRELTIEIPGRPPTPNSRRHWRAIAKDNEAWGERAVVACMDAISERPFGEWTGLEVIRPRIEGKRGKVTPLLTRAGNPILYAVEYVMVFVVPTNTERDWDNAVASGKPLTDGLVRAGVLAGDSTKYIDPAGRRVTFLHQATLSKVVIRVVEGLPPGTLGL